MRLRMYWIDPHHEAAGGFDHQAMAATQNSAKLFREGRDGYEPCDGAAAHHDEGTARTGHYRGSSGEQHGRCERLSQLVERATPVVPVEAGRPARFNTTLQPAGLAPAEVAAGAAGKRRAFCRRNGAAVRKSAAGDFF